MDNQKDELHPTRIMRPGTEELAIHLWLDSCYNAAWCTLMTVGDAGIDFIDLVDELTAEWWRLLAYLRRN